MPERPPRYRRWTLRTSLLAALWPQLAAARREGRVIEVSARSAGAMASWPAARPAAATVRGEARPEAGGQRRLLVDADREVSFPIPGESGRAESADDPALADLAAFIDAALLQLDANLLAAEVSVQTARAQVSSDLQEIGLDPATWPDAAARRRAAAWIVGARQRAGCSEAAFTGALAAIYGLSARLEPIDPLGVERRDQRAAGGASLLGAAGARLGVSAALGPGVDLPHFRRRLVFGRARAADYARRAGCPRFVRQLQDLADWLLPVFVTLNAWRWEIVAQDRARRLGAGRLGATASLTRCQAVK